ncbi:hypothetical protein C2857_003104 [Epichloe festucae Fl1]|uniref:Borealin N-terminal domain-containing protein n=1 Tax=Epichloe festucae (strain Fl1) TaxID=877507 RepID=A0A7S9KRY4_EPIFF|nr:hypothetical protein C2857_003104 [Epichloe festucae Fl1]
MAPTKSKRKVSDQTTAAVNRQDTKVSIKSPSTPTARSPIKKRKMGLSAQQKQALIDNLQLEVTERARRLRAQYQLQAQGLRSRIEIRINRIPMSLRKLKIGHLLDKHAEQEQSRDVSNPPPVPAKDTPRSSPQRSLPARAQAVGRGYKRMSNEISGDKENEVENVEGTKKRVRVPQADTGRVRPNQVLSPTSSNSRLANRERPASPTKSYIARPGSPLKATGTSRSAAATNVLSNMVEKAKATRARGTRKVTTTSETSSTSTGTTAASRVRRNGAATTAKAPASRPATRAGRRPRNTSETSEASAGTVVRKASAAPKAGPTTKSTMMRAIRKGVAGGTKRAAAAAATKSTATPATTTASGRVLRKRG